MKKVIVCFMVVGMLNVVQASWVVSTDGPLDMANNGLLVKASNFGDGAASQTINDIAYDVDYSNIDSPDPTSHSWADKFYTGTDPAIDNLLNTGAKVSQWGPNNLNVNLSGLTVGHDYRFQVLIGGAWNGAGCNLYGTAREYKYVGLSGSQPKLATFSWTADSEDGTININSGGGQGTQFVLGYAMHNTTIPEPASMLLLGIGGWLGLRRRR